MDFELEATRPSSHRSFVVSWLAATSGVALVLIALGTGEARSAPGIEAASSSSPAITVTQDPLTTSSITPALAPIKASAVERAPSRHSNLPPSERHVLILLLLACFALMATGAYSMWRRSWNSIVGKETIADR
jgi:hypothetical protein